MGVDHDLVALLELGRQIGVEHLPVPYDRGKTDPLWHFYVSEHHAADRYPGLHIYDVEPFYYKSHYLSHKEITAWN